MGAVEVGLGYSDKLGHARIRHIKHDRKVGTASSNFPTWASPDVRLPAVQPRSSSVQLAAMAHSSSGAEPVLAVEDFCGAWGGVEVILVAEGVGEDAACGGGVSFVDHDAGEVESGGFGVGVGLQGGGDGSFGGFEVSGLYVFRCNSDLGGTR